MSCRFAERSVLKLVFLMILFVVAWLLSAFRVVAYLHAPNEDGRPWRDSTLLAGGCPA